MWRVAWCLCFYLKSYRVVSMWDLPIRIQPVLALNVSKHCESSDKYLFRGRPNEFPLFVLNLIDTESVENHTGKNTC